MANHTTEHKLRELANKGLSSKQIAQELGLCHSMLRAALSILGISTRGNEEQTGYPARAISSVSPPS